jgi:hypothetical protein
MRAAGRQSAIQLGLTERPWVSPSVMLVSPLTADENGIRITLRVQLTNVGNSPAMGIWITPVLFLLSVSKPGVAEERKRTCEQVANRPPDLGQVLFPNATPPFIQDWTISATAEDVRNASVGVAEGAEGGEDPYAKGMYMAQIILCVSYRSTLDPAARHYTAPIYDLSLINPANPQMMLALPGQTSVPLERLRLTGSFLGTIAA